MPTRSDLSDGWLSPDEREEIVRRNIADDTPLVDRQRDLSRLLAIATAASRAREAARNADPTESGTSADGARADKS
ncbi:MAG: hypothetical protein H3C62_01015 [Gemmatimonadaceae bacterium]|nr:hypothetical protein [Gemmatimonadaceae bacterium]